MGLATLYIAEFVAEHGYDPRWYLGPACDEWWRLYDLDNKEQARMKKKASRRLVGFLIVRTWPQHEFSKKPPREDEILERWEDPSPDREAELRRKVVRLNLARFSAGHPEANYELRNLYEDEV